MKRATVLSRNNEIWIAISIHALVKRATNQKDTTTLMLSISIHALVKRATFKQTSRLSNTTYFNPRPREEGDPTV